MRILKTTVGILATNCYSVLCESGKRAAVIDPGGDPEAILGPLDEAGATVTAILLTHGHVDHIGGLTVLAERTGAPIHIHPEDAALLTAVEEEFRSLIPDNYRPPAETIPLADGQRLAVGELCIGVLHTPGHTRGSCSFLLEAKHLFTGDLLFAGSVGRTDLAGGDWLSLARSLRERILALEDDTLIHPGHGEETTLADEKAANPFLAPERLRWEG